MGYLKVALFALLAFIVCMPVLAKESTISQIMQAMEQTGVEPTEVEVRTSIDLGVVSATKDLEALTREWQDKLAVPYNGKTGNQKNQIIYESHTIKGGATIKFRMIGVPHNSKIHAYLVLLITGTGKNAQDVEKARKEVSLLLTKASRIPQFSTCISGIYSDKLSVDQQGDKVKSVLSSLQAKEIERLQDETVTSISAYTERWESFINSGQNKMNVQVATHLDALHSQTRIKVGTPIITAEY
ncbi:YwmB family TATA-box binding protein [Brevibacillus sp. SYSU BS000544]|uniref:YwmB family TATA-box binding protein n=1 Tax=Brevibacillus sp. SYSU BS000544 TaxID=3416443 RepID=UPI003CE486FA